MPLYPVFPLSGLDVLLRRTVNPPRSEHLSGIRYGQPLMGELLPEMRPWNHLTLFQAAPQQLNRFLPGKARHYTLHIGNLPT